jgi:hypothetical protein
VGSCKDCPKRTGNQKELFADVKSADVCTDPKCWEGKRLASVSEKQAALEAKGIKVVVGTPAQDYNGPIIEPPKGYAPLDHYDHERWGRLGEVIKKGKLEVKPVAMFDAKGHKVDLVRLADLPKKAKSASKSGGYGTVDYDSKWKAQQKIRDAKQKAVDGVVALILARISRGELSGDVAWRLIARAFGTPYAPGKKAKGGGDVAKLSGKALIARVFEIAIDHDFADFSDELELLPQLCAHFGIDHKAAIDAEVAQAAPKPKDKNKDKNKDKKPEKSAKGAKGKKK